MPFMCSILEFACKFIFKHHLFKIIDDQISLDISNILPPKLYMCQNLPDVLNIHISRTSNLCWIPVLKMTLDACISEYLNIFDILTPLDLCP